MHDLLRQQLVMAVSLLAAAIACAADTAKPEVVRLWPKPPGQVQPGQPERTDKVKWRGDRTLLKTSHVSDPTITVYRPANPAAEPTPAVVICPGGGYGILAWDLEGTEVAEWLNSLGIAGVVLKYRVPRQRDGALQDAQRAVSLVRSRAKAWSIHPGRVGILGFSAGGHLAARTATNHEKRTYQPADDADKQSCRPDFTVLIYPAYLTAKDGEKLDAATLPVGPTTPGTFIAVAFNDKFAPGALHYFQALRKARVRSELHVFHSGGHGCGLRESDANVTTWPAHCARWFRELGILPAAKAPSKAKP